MVFDFTTLVPPAITALISGFGGYAVANRVARSNEKIAQINHEPKPEDVDRSAGSLTRRFQVLMDGYEGHIQSLTEEVQGLRTEVRDLRQELLDRCVNCRYRLEVTSRA